MHTDVPEFRGANRKLVPQWLLVVMHHSGLFEDYRMPIATGDRVVPRLRRRRARVLARRRRPARAAAPSALQHRDGARHRLACSTASTASPTSPPTSCRGSARARRSTSPATAPGSLHDADGDELARYDWERAALLGVVEGVLLRATSTSATPGATTATTSRSTSILDRSSTTSARAVASTATSTRDAELGRLLIDEYIRFPVSTSSSTS